MPELERPTPHPLPPEQQLQQLHVVHEAFVRAVSHDLRAPLRHLTSFAPLLREAVDVLAQRDVGSEAAQDAVEFVGMMEQSARKMGAMLDGVMLVSRAARHPLTMADIDATAVLHACAAQLAHRAPGAHWDLPAHPVWVWADATALQSVLLALMDNAVKFSAGQAHSVLQVRVSRPEEGLWQLAICDHGVGCDSTRLSPAWPPFQRLHREQEFAGVGCGLAQAYTWISRHGGDLSLQSLPGAGCIATMRWPAAPSPVHPT